MSAHSRSRAVARLAGASVLALGAALSTQALAQGANTGEVAEVVVTASRIQREGFVAPTPTQVTSAEVLKSQNLFNVGDLLTQQPAIRGTANANAGTFQTNQNNLYTNPGAVYINLRNLGSGEVGTASRTLTLVDGNRIVFQSSGGATNINIIPTMALERTEIVTGGSSAQYGSEAVAGVVNLILRKRYEGLQFEASYGESKYSDNLTYHAGIIAGHDFLDGRLHVMGSAEFNSTKGVQVGSYNPRKWAAAANGTITGAGNIRYLASDINLNNQTDGGIVTAANGASVTALNSTSPFHGLAFNAQGVPYRFQYGDTKGNNNSTLQSGGQPENKYQNNGDTASSVLPLTRTSYLFRTNYDFTPHFNAGVTLMYATDETEHPTVTPRWPGGSGITPVSWLIRRDNPYLPASVATLMDQNNVSTITLGKVFHEYGAYNVHAEDQTYQGSFDMNGDFDALSKNWTWDAHAGWGKVEVFTANLNNIKDANLQNAINSIRDPATGQIVCSSVAARAAGCVPLNPFGGAQLFAQPTGVITDALRNYITGQSLQYQRTSRTDLNFNLRGEPVSTWAGPVSIAVGAEYRKDNIRQTADEESVQRRFYGDNNAPYAGSISVTEGYAEALVPLAKDMAFAKSLDLNAAIREAHYNTTGNVTSYKIGGTWQVIDDIRFRASYSQDVRAPNPTELFFAPQASTTLVTARLPTQPYNGALATEAVPLQAGSQQVQGTGISQGNLNLRPEKAHTYTYGVVVTPTFIPGFRASVDYYHIDIGNAIFTPAVQQIVTNCQAGQTAYCANMTYIAGGTNIQFRLQPLNISNLINSGFDISAAYTTPLARFSESLPGFLALSLNGNYTQHQILKVPGAPDVDTAGQLGGGVVQTGTSAPHWMWDANINYKIANVGLNVHFRRIGAGVLDVSAKPGRPNAALLSFPNHAGSLFYTNVGVNVGIPTRYTMGKEIEVFANVNNLFDVDPNIIGNDPSRDIIGRFYSGGFRIRL
jgi:outer membrane receptor protein involved in Fe transport